VADFIDDAVAVIFCGTSNPTYQVIEQPPMCEEPGDRSDRGTMEDHAPPRLPDVHCMRPDAMSVRQSTVEHPAARHLNLAQEG